MRHLASSDLRQLSPQEIELELVHEFQQLTNVELANYIQLGLLRAGSPDHQDGLEYALSEARGRVSPEVRAIEVRALLENRFAAGSGAQFLIEGLRDL